MFQSSETWADEIGPVVDPARRNANETGDAFAAPAGRYGEGRRVNLPAIIVTVLFHVALLTAILLVRSEVVRERESRLTMVELAPPPAPEPPPPAPSKSEETPPTEPKLVAPVPVIQLPRPITSPPAAPPTPPAEPQQDSPPSEATSPSIPRIPVIARDPVQGGDLGTRMISAPPPSYPLESRRQREQGTVVLSLTLGVDGRVASISIAQSSGFSRLDNAALHAVRRWRWAPTLRNGEPVMVKGRVEIPFVLKG